MIDGLEILVLEKLDVLTSSKITCVESFFTVSPMVMKPLALLRIFKPTLCMKQKAFLQRISLIYKMKFTTCLNVALSLGCYRSSLFSIGELSWSPPALA